MQRRRAAVLANGEAGTQEAPGVEDKKELDKKTKEKLAMWKEYLDSCTKVVDENKEALLPVKSFVAPVVDKHFEDMTLAETSYSL